MPKFPRGLVRRGRWYYARTYEDGQEKRISLRTADYNEACKLLKRVRLGQPLDDDAAQPGAIEEVLTLEQAAKIWLSTHVKIQRSEKNAAMTEARFHNYMEAFFGADTPVTSIKRLSLERYVVWLKARKKPNGKTLSLQTVRHLLADLRAFLLWCVDTGHISKNPMPRKFLPRVPEQDPQGFTAEEIGKLRGLEGEHGYVCRFLLATGVRWGEAIQARSTDVRDGCLVVMKSKNKRVRRVPIPPELLSELNERPAGRLIPFSEPGSFARIVRDRSGVSTFRVHRCRHHFAIDWLARGGNLKALSFVLGHGSIAVTERYGKLSDQHVRDEATRIWAATRTNGLKQDHSPQSSTAA